MKYYVQWKNFGKENVVPRFYHKVPLEYDSLQRKVREEARALFIERKTRDQLDDKDLKHLSTVLTENKSSTHGTDDHMINYRNFKAVAACIDSKFKPFFTARVFSKLLQSDSQGCISIRHFFNYVMRKVWLHQTRITLSLYDVSGLGFLGEAELDNYILELIPTLPQLKGLEESFIEYYGVTAVRKFFFFLDPLHTGKVKIQDILACSLLDDLLELQVSDLPKDVQEANWFSATSALRVYGQYLNLDTDRNGFLSKDELAKYGTGTLTPVFIDRVFQECLTYDKKMDYKSYLDFVLALENRKEPQALQYFFRILDLQQKNYITEFDFNYFFRAIQDQMKQHGQKPVLFEDVKDEIFDMIKPADPTKVTLSDLVLCGQGDTVVSMVIDVNDFWTYENREVLVATSLDEGEA